MKIAEQKTNSIVILNVPLWCIFVINDRIIDQVSQIDFLGTRLTSINSADEEIEHQLMKVKRIAGCMTNLIWNNKNITHEAVIMVLGFKKSQYLQ